MDAAAMAASLRVLPPHEHPFRLSPSPRSRTTHITCSLRNDRRGTLWRSFVLSTEAIQAVQALKLAKSTPRLEQVLSERLSRLLKMDLLTALGELQRQNEVELALKVFKQVKREVWYKPDIRLHCDMIQLLGRNKLFAVAEAVFAEIWKDGMKPDTRAYTEMIGLYFEADMVEEAMRVYEMMKASKCPPDKLTLTIVIKNLERAGQDELAATVKSECFEYVDFPRKFLKEVEKNHERRAIDLV